MRCSKLYTTNRYYNKLIAKNTINVLNKQLQFNMLTRHLFAQSNMTLHTLSNGSTQHNCIVNHNSVTHDNHKQHNNNNHNNCLYTTSTTTDPAISKQYTELLNDLYSVNITRKVRLGIETTQSLLSHVTSLYSPYNMPIIHVGGTNGKGSVSTKIAKIFELHGLRVGLFTSPHISTFRERMSINGELITESQVCKLLPLLLQTTQQYDIPATFFEITTLLGFGYFNSLECDICVIEVGLGGRLDSTNIVDPVLSVITSIDIDHTEYLGNTIEKITYEKAGIIKKNRPVVIGPTVPYQQIKDIAQQKNSTLYVVEHKSSNYDDENNHVTSLAIDVLKDNDTVFKLLNKYNHQNFDNKLVRHGLHARPYCRFQQYEYNITNKQCNDVNVPNDVIAKSYNNTTTQQHSQNNNDILPIVLDVGHNPAAFLRLFEMIKQYYHNYNIHCIVGFSREKDAVACLTTLIDNAQYLYFVKANSSRATTTESLLQTIEQHRLNTQQQCNINVVHNGAVYDTVQHVLDKLTTQRQQQPSQSTVTDILVICGTFFIMRDVKAALGLHQYIDPFELNETHASKRPPIHVDSNRNNTISN